MGQTLALSIILVYVLVGITALTDSLSLWYSSQRLETSSGERSESSSSFKMAPMKYAVGDGVRDAAL